MYKIFPFVIFIFYGINVLGQNKINQIEINPKYSLGFKFAG